MKKILLLIPIIGFAFLSFGQLAPAPVTNSTTTGVVAGGDIATCSFAPGTPQSCIHVCRNSILITGGPTSASPRTVSFKYYQVTNGAKSLHVIILCGNSILVNDCINASGDAQDVLVYKEYTGVICTNKSEMTIKIQAHTNGSCGGNECGPLLVSTNESPLPVTFKSFTTTRNKSNVIVKWETASEQNNSGFAVERNINGTWEQVAFVPSQAVNGTSTSDLSYQFIDLNNTKGITQYRIKQVDIDAKSKYSEVRSVRGDGQIGKTIIYPNPSSDGKVNIVFEETNVSRDISVADMSGRTVKQLKGITANNITIENLTPGIYSLRIVVPATGDQSVEKIVVNKR